MTAAAPVERTAPYLRPHQVQALNAEKNAIIDTLQAPDYIRNQIHDKGALVKQVRSIEKLLHEDGPKVYAEGEIDPAVRRERELRDDLTHGMPTQAEMRRAPPGAVDKHRKWEAENKAKILEWKNLRIRLHASGMLDEHPTATDVANLERFRPVGGAHELNMDNALIDGKSIHLPPRIAVTNVMSEEDRAAMFARDAELAAAAAKAAIDRLLERSAEAAPAGGGSKRNNGG